MQSQRGVAAVEFALVVPTFIILLGVFFTVGRAYWAQNILMDAISYAARDCILEQRPVAPNATTRSDSTAQLTTCATGKMSTELGKYSSICGANAALQPSAPVVQAVPSAAVPTAPLNNVRLLRLTVKCNIPVLFFVASSPTIPIVARVALPFLN